MLAAQADVQRVAPAMLDQMSTDEMKKRAREASTDDIDVDGDKRSFIPAVGESQPLDQTTQQQEQPHPPPVHRPYPPSEVGVHPLNAEHAAHLAAELASAASTNTSTPHRLHFTGYLSVPHIHSPTQKGHVSVPFAEDARRVRRA